MFGDNSVGIISAVLSFSLLSQTDERLRRYLSEAIGLCSMCRCNRASFGDSGAVAPLVRYLKSKDERVHQRTAMALYQLSRNPNNIITMHAKGAVKVSFIVKRKFVSLMFGTWPLLLATAAIYLSFVTPQARFCL